MLPRHWLAALPWLVGTEAKFGSHRRACALDEHCAFVLGAEVDDDVIRVKKANRVTFHHVP